MEKILVSIPDDLAARMRTTIPSRKRSGVIAELLKKEIERREQLLYQCALDVEEDEMLNTDMIAWDVTLKDGLEDEPR